MASDQSREGTAQSGDRVYREIVRAWRGRDGTRYRYVVCEIDGEVRNIVEKDDGERYVVVD